MNYSLEQDINQGYKDLANAIVLQAILDYKDSPKVAVGDMRRLRIERFINSKYFTELCGLNQEWLVNKLRSEADKGGRVSESHVSRLPKVR